jgi:hypothetical protein
MKKALAGLVFILLVAYILFQARFLILGPRIFVTTPVDNQSLSDPVIVVSGRVENVVSLTLDDRAIYPDQSGVWQDKLLAGPGLNIIKLDAKDRFGRETETLLHVVLN